MRGALKVDREISESGPEISELAWSTWIWCQLFNSLMLDQSSSLHGNPEVVGLHKQLRAAGIAGGDYTTVISEVRKKKHKFTVPKVYEYSSESEADDKSTSDSCEIF
ncbi:hypothetical protein SUDANB95_06389 [Actinosynnema sp. ALI-1.44]